MDRPPQGAQPTGPLDAVARAQATAPSTVAIAAALAQPWVDVVLSGAVTTEQLQENLAARALRLDAGSLDALSALGETPAEYWSTRARMPWT